MMRTVVVPVGNVVQRDSAVEDSTWLEHTVEHLGHEPSLYRGTPALLMTVP